MIFIRVDYQKGANQLIYYKFAILLKPGLCRASGKAGKRNPEQEREWEQEPEPEQETATEQEQ